MHNPRVLFNLRSLCEDSQPMHCDDHSNCVWWLCTKLQSCEWSLHIREMILFMADTDDN